MKQTPPMRSRIRARTTEILAGLAPFQGHVFNARTPSLRRDLLPAVRIYATADTRQNESDIHDLGWFRGQLTLVVQIVVEAGADPAVSDRLDRFCALAEAALMGDDAWREMAQRVDSIETDFALDGQGELRTAVATITLSVVYTDCFERRFPDELQRIAVRLDFVDPPADPNTGSPPAGVPGGYPGGPPGPDGRTEYGAEFDLPRPEGSP